MTCQTLKNNYYFLADGLKSWKVLKINNLQMVVFPVIAKIVFRLSSIVNRVADFLIFVFVRIYKNVDF
jgi:hypothetical protein